MSTSLPVSIIMPAFRAQETICQSIISVLAQTHRDFEIIVVADDGADYESLIAGAGLADPRIRYLTTGQTASGSSAARNVALDAARYSLVAILDADDRFAPDKLEIMAPLAKAHGMASCALDLILPDNTPLRTLGMGENRLLSAAHYKFVNFSMDSMLVYDRERIDPRYDPALPCMTDFEFLLKLFARFPACYHLGRPLHAYVKMAASISNGEGVKDRMIAAKTLLRERLMHGHYPLADPDALAGLIRFLDISMEAERDYAPRQGLARPDLFEDHLEPRLSAP